MTVEHVLSLVAAALTGAGTTGAVALRSRSSREARFYKDVDQRMQQLEAKVKECEAERPVLAILRLGVCLMVPEVQRLSRLCGEPRNPVLDQVQNAFRALPQDKDDLNDLLDELRREPGVYTPAEGREKGNAA